MSLFYLRTYGRVQTLRAPVVITFVGSYYKWFHYRIYAHPSEISQNLPQFNLFFIETLSSSTHIRNHIRMVPQRGKGVEQLTRTALNAIEGFKAFQKGTKNRDDFPETGDTEDCFPEYTNLERECRERGERGEDRYRTFDGTCNNLNEVITVIIISKPFSMACGKINVTHLNMLPQYSVVQKKILACLNFPPSSHPLT